MHEFVSGKKQQPTTVRRTRSTAVHGFDAGKQADRTDVRNIIRPTPVQTKLALGAPNDRYEQEADAVADRVMRMSDTDVAQRVDKGTVQPMLIQRMSPEYKNALALRQTQGDEEAVQAKKNAGETASVTSHVESGINSLKGGGQPLDTTTRSFFEPRFGRDFGNVRVHTGGQAPDLSRSINARAFTFGNDVVFGSGQYRPSSLEGRRLLGHELTHVVQQQNNDKNHIQRLMGFEFQTNNVVSKNTDKGVKYFKRGESKDNPLRKTSSGLEMQIDTGSVIEFVTKASSTWPEQEAQLKDAEAIVEEIKELKQEKRDPSEDAPEKGNPKVYRGFSASTYGDVDVTVEKGNFRGKPQSTIGIPLDAYTRLLTRYQGDRKNRGKYAVSEAYTELKTKSGNLYLSGELEGFLKVIIHYILQAKKSLVGSHSKVAQPKDHFHLMSRVDFASMYRHLDKADKEIFATLLPHICKSTGVNKDDDLFANGYWGWVKVDEVSKRVFIKGGEVVKVREGSEGNYSFVGKGEAGADKRFFKKNLKKVTIETWFNSMMKKRGKDLTSPLPTYKGDEKMGYAMGLWDLRDDKLFPFEVRNHPSMGIDEWREFAKDQFLRASFIFGAGLSMSEPDTTE